METVTAIYIIIDIIALVAALAGCWAFGNL